MSGIRGSAPCARACAKLAALESRILLRISLALAIVFAPLQAADNSQGEPRLVDLNVVAVDSHGQPVSDLTSDDFRVSDGGKEQRIAFFHHTDSSRWQIKSLGPNEFSNRNNGAIPYATVILFDLLNESFASRGYAEDQLVHALEKLENTDYLYLYFLTVDGRLYVVHGLPGTREPAAKPTGVSEEVQGSWTRQIKSLLDSSLRTVNQQRPFDIDVVGRVILTFQALDSLATQLSRAPGRKNIVWISDGVPIALGPGRSDTGDFVDFTPRLRKLAATLGRSGVAIYPVRQVIYGGPDEIGATSNGAGATGGAGTGIESLETLNEFAGLTGGRLSTGKDISGVLRQALNDVHTSYQMGYYPSEENWDDKFHKIAVACKRKGVKIEAKTGYYALSEPAGTYAQRAFVTAATNDFDSAEIGLRASVSTDPKDGHVTHFDLRIDAHDVAFVHEGNDYSAQLRLTVVHYLNDGHTESEMIMPFDLHYDAAQREDALKTGVDVAQDLPMGHPGYQFRVIVFDRGSNATGSLTIPDYAKSGLVLPQLNEK